MNRPRYEVCGRCGQEWMVSKILPRRRPDELYICPRCARRGEGVFVRRK